MTKKEETDYDRAANKLARFLFDTMEYLDPNGGHWDKLSDNDREFYRDVILSLADKPDAWNILFQVPDEHSVPRELK